MQKTKIDFDLSDFDDLNSFLDMLRDRLADSFAGKTVYELLGISPARMTLSEKLDLSSKVENDTIIVSSNIFIQSEEMAKEFDIQNSGIQDLMKSAAVLEIMGFERLAKQMRKLYAESLAEMFMSNVREEEFAKQVISQDRSKARKGKTNRHHNAALKIAADTWAKYPHASLAGLSEDIYSHLRKKWNDVPVAGTVEKWLKESKLNPDVKPKNRNYELIVIDEE